MNWTLCLTTGCTILLVTLAGCDLSAVKYEKALAHVQSVGVCLVASRFVRLDGNVLHGVSLTKDSPTLYAVLLGNHVEALDSAIRSNRSQGLSLERIESLIEDVSSLNATSPEEYAKRKLDEERIFSNHEARRDSSLRLALKYSKDAILWILVNYDTAKKPAAQYYKGPLSPVVFWEVELYGRDGRKLFADQYRQAGADTVGDFNEGERDVFTVIHPSTYARANQTLAIGLSRDGRGSLTQSIITARAAK